jgi:hypothetical protein
MDILVSLKYLFDNKFSFMLIDILLYLVLLYTLYVFSYDILPKVLTQHQKKKYKKLRYILSFVLLTILCLMIFQFTILIITPHNQYFNSNVKMNIFEILNSSIFLVIFILRLVSILIVISIIVNYVYILGRKINLVPFGIWIIFIFILSIIHIYALMYTLFPTLNPILYIYEIFYNIRSLFAINYNNDQLTESQVQSRIQSLLKKLSCHFGGYIPKYAYSTIRDQWVMDNNVENYLTRNYNCNPS